MKQKLKFPNGFLWGAATSAYQVEGGISNNDWAVTDRVPKAGLACDHYHRYQEDFKLAKYLHQNAHRLSLEWSRIEPQKGRFDESALHHYHEVLSFLKQNGFTTFVTLHHFTNPVWFVKKGGWASVKAPKYFGDYTARVAQSLGHLVDFWITVNEPMLYAYMGYGRGIFPPFRKNYMQSFKVYRNMLAAHNDAYRIIHRYYHEASVGFAHNIGFNEGGIAAKVLNYMQIDYPYTRTLNDFVGLNFYFHRKFGFLLNQKPKNMELTDRGWPIYPQGLHEVLMKLKKFNLPIYITENGLADARDEKRERYIKSYLAAAHQAIELGADVRGYLHWSLIDNFEWEDGYKWKFGLVAVDFKTQKRTIRESAFVYSHICQDNAIEITNNK